VAEALFEVGSQRPERPLVPPKACHLPRDGNRSATENRDHAAACDFWSLSGSRDGAGSPRNAASCAAVR
jgi:hypothetical protein